MTDHTQLSFTATVLINGYPLIVLEQATDAAVTVPHLDSSLGSMDVSRCLGVLSTPDDTWDSAREEGLVDFHITRAPAPAVFYFRHSDQGYHLYLRGGDHAGLCIRKSKYGLPMATSPDDTPVSAWHMLRAHSGEQVTLNDLVSDSAVLHLACASTTNCLTTRFIAQGEGAYLAASRLGTKASLRLNILERGANWAR